jgi:hypothetical protein
MATITAFQGGTPEGYGRPLAAGETIAYSSFGLAYSFSPIHARAAVTVTFDSADVIASFSLPMRDVYTNLPGSVAAATGIAATVYIVAAPNVTTLGSWTLPSGGVWTFT